MKTIGLTVLLCLVATPAFAQDPEPTYPEASPSTAPAAWPQAAVPINSPPVESHSRERRTGFHISIGGGFGGGNGRPGIGTQFKIGYRLNADWVVYYYALNDWYRTVGTQGPTIVNGQVSASGTQAHFRIAAINGVGVDYFVVPRLGVRFAVGAGVNAPEDLFGNGKRYYGYSYVMGLTCGIGDEDSHFSIDPAIHLLQTSVNGTWNSTPYFLLTANWVLN